MARSRTALRRSAPPCTPRTLSRRWAMPNAWIEYEACREVRFGVKPFGFGPSHCWRRTKTAPDEFGVGFRITVPVIDGVVVVIAAAVKEPLDQAQRIQAGGFPCESLDIREANWEPQTIPSDFSYRRDRPGDSPARKGKHAIWMEYGEPVHKVA